MKLTAFCLHRPVTTLMFFVGIIILGGISWYFLPQELFPPLIYPQITILTKYQQASPQEIESLITRPIEEAVGTVNRVKRVSSISREGTSIVIVELAWGTNMDFAALEVREKVDLIKEKLPREAEEPIVMKYNPFEMPTMRIVLTGEENPLKLRKIAKKDIKEELEKLEGVGAIEVVGGLEREITVNIDEAKLRSANLSILDISLALKRANINYPAGRIKEPFFEYLIRTVGEFKKINEVRELPVKAEFPLSERKSHYLRKFYEEKEKEEGIYFPESERLIFIKDIAEVVDGEKERDSISRFQGKECVMLLIRKQSLANVVKLSKRIREELKKIKRKLPSNLQLKIIYDEADFIKKSLKDVRNAALQGAGLAFLVVLFFLRNVFLSLSIIISIPLCILLVLLFLYLSRISLNLISLGGLALGVGMLVDNAIVVLESIFVHPSPDINEKTIRGTKEVGGAILGSTLTTVCVFLPMIFVVGIAGQLFKQLSFSIVFSLIASLFSALTLLPLLVYFILKRKTRFSSEFKIKGWDKIFTFLFRRRVIVLSIVGFLFLFSIYIFSHLERELFPHVDQHEFIIKVDAKPGTPLEETDKIVRKIEKVLSSFPQIKEVTVNIGSPQEETKEKVIQSQGPHQAQIFVRLDKKTKTSFLIEKLEKKLEPIKKEASLILLAQESFLKEAFVQQAPLILEIKGENLSRLKEIGLILEKELKRLPFLYNVKLDYPAPRPEVKVKVTKDKAFLYNISTDIVAATVNTSLKGNVPTKFKEKGEEYDIKVILRKKDRRNIRKLKRLLIHGLFQDKKITVPLMEVAKIEKGFGPIEIRRIEGEKTLLLTASIYLMPLSKVVKKVNRIVKKVHIPQGYKVEITGEAQNMKESFNSLRFALILAIVFVFMIMASEFESLWQPFLILFTLPLSIIGIVLLLLATHSTLNVISLLGLIMLGGIIVNNGIVLIDYINFLRREKKLPLEEAINVASSRRIRPILMTSLTTILGLLPLSIGKGTTIMQPLGIITMGGLLSATFLTPVVLPILYYYFDKIFHLGREKKEKKTSLRKTEILQKEVEIFKESPKEEKVEREISEKKPTEGKVFEEDIEKEKVAPERIKTEKETKSKKEIAPLKFSHRQKELINYLKEHKKITRTQYAKLFGISIPTAARDLKKLLSAGIIEARGPLGPGRIYILKEKDESG
ncbi:MAG: efflux RND transporter permease subunit [Candidatus Omnitrophica bacterium]|nr:efflux RND transporter permease subunit [Candidatus Omnitrophota bacterium]